MNAEERLAWILGLAERYGQGRRGGAQVAVALLVTETSENERGIFREMLVREQGRIRAAEERLGRWPKEEERENSATD